MQKSRGELVLPLTMFDVAMFSLQTKTGKEIVRAIMKSALSLVSFWEKSSPEQGKKASTTEWSWSDYWDFGKKVATGTGSLATGALKAGWDLGKGYWHGSNDKYFDALCTLLRSAPDLKTIVRILLMVIVPALEVIAHPEEYINTRKNLVLERFDDLLKWAIPSADYYIEQSKGLQNLSTGEIDVIVGLRWSNLEATKDMQDTSDFMKELDDLFERVQAALADKFVRQEIFEWKVSGGLLNDVRDIKGPVGSSQFAELFLKPLVGKEKYDELKAKEGTKIFPSLIDDDTKHLPPLSDDEFKRMLDTNATLVRKNRDYLHKLLST